MKKMVDFNKGYETVNVIISSVEEFNQLKKDNPTSDFASLDVYPNYRIPRKSNGNAYKFNIDNCKTAIEIAGETEKAYRLQVSHISRYFKGQPDKRHFKWVAKSLVNIIDGVIYYPNFC